MSHEIQNKIGAKEITIENLLARQKFYLDYFQREYNWEEKHITALVEDLTEAFLFSYTSNDERSDVEKYKNYYLGPVVFSTINGKKSIIDGQQRITSITLILIYLKHLQKKKFKEEHRVPIDDLIFSQKHGDKSFNMTDEDRKRCLDSLYNNGEYESTGADSTTVKNLANRYNDISKIFPESIKNESLAHFIDWFKENVFLVEIMTYSEDNAYTIFETMNDRGLNLSPTEMLKGYVLSKIEDKKQQDEINELWKEQIQKLNIGRNRNVDQGFFHAWFRAKYADSEKQDFEKIGSRFHHWFKEKHETLFNLKPSNDFYSFFKKEFPFYVRWYLYILTARYQYNSQLPHVHYINTWGFADSLRDPLLLSTLCSTEQEDSINKKIDLVGKFIEAFTVLKTVNGKSSAHSAIKYSMFNIVKKIRNNDEQKLLKNLSEEIDKVPQKWDAMSNFGLRSRNSNFMKHLLSRISSYVDNLNGQSTTYVTYHHPEGKPFEIEHIWANKFEQHSDEFEQNEEFQNWRNLIGALVLLPNGTNQSYKDAPYSEKVKHYIKENTFVKSLCSGCYENNPNFTNNPTIQLLGFKPHTEFKKTDITERTELVKKICEKIWCFDA